MRSDNDVAANDSADMQACVKLTLGKTEHELPEHMAGRAISDVSGDLKQSAPLRMSSRCRVNALFVMKAAGLIAMASITLTVSALNIAILLGGKSLEFVRGLLLAAKSIWSGVI